jgi:hypothetical protein
LLCIRTGARSARSCKCSISICRIPIIRRSVGMHAGCRFNPMGKLERANST